MTKFYITVFFGIALLVINFIPVVLINDDEDINEGSGAPELFDSSLNRIKTIDKLVDVIDSIAYTEKCIPHSLEYNEIITNVIKYRFRHGYSHYSLNQNWIASVMGYFIWKDFSAIVIPNDILRYPHAACSQQSMVMMEVLRHKGIPFKKVSWNHHFTLCAWVDNSWQFYDPNMEPILSINERKFDDKFNDIDFLAKIYQKRLNRNDVESFFGKPVTGNPNEFPAKRIKYFHILSLIVSKSLWFLVLVYGFYIYYKNKKGKAAITYQI